MDLHQLNGPENHNRGPATNEHSEHGDTWKEAIEKINANFKALVEHVETATIAGYDAIHDRLTAVEQKPAEDVKALHARIAELEAQVKAFTTPAPTPPAPPLAPTDIPQQQG